MGNLCKNHYGSRYRKQSTLYRPKSPKPTFTYIASRPQPSSNPQGLPNIGNTCFANAALQCILNTEVLQKHLTQTQSNKQFTKELKSMFKSKKSESIDPSSLLRLVWQNSSVFHPGQQNDAHEFTVFILDKLHEELKVPYKEPKGLEMDKAQKSWARYLEKNYSIVSEEFQGQLKTTLVCQKCQNTKERYEPFMYLSLSINPDTSSVEDCLTSYQKEELLSGSNSWYCKSCQSPENALKKTTIYRVPNYLIIHLKRFKNQSTKNSDFINYSESLHLSTSLQTQFSFELYSKIKHMGIISGGHYIAVSKQDNIWYNFNDNSVEKTTFSSSADTYLLFYKKL